MRVREDIRSLTGPEKAAILVLSLGEDHTAKIFSLMDDEEIKEISQTMANLGTINSNIVERLFVDFADHISATGSLVGTYESTEVLLANYLKNEYPQTVAVVLSKIKSEHAARVLSQLPESFAMEVVMRMLRMEAVQKEVLDDVERTLRNEFFTNLARTNRRDAHELIAEIFNSLDRSTETRFITALEERNRDSAERIKALMFTFEDLAKLDSTAVQAVLRNADKVKVPIALKGASEALRDLFFSNMSERSGKLLKEEMQAMGPVRLRDVEEAQGYLVALAKDLAASGEIVIADSKGDDELVY